MWSAILRGLETMRPYAGDFCDMNTYIQQKFIYISEEASVEIFGVADFYPEHVCSFETSVNFYPTTWVTYQDGHLHTASLRQRGLRNRLISCEVSYEVEYCRTLLKRHRHRFMRHLAYTVRYSVVQMNSSLLTITLYSLVITTLVYNDTNYSVPFMTL
jgi:hypothetical protein